MKRIERIEDELHKLAGKETTATDIARRLDLARANVSSDLNRLCEMGLAQKRGSKPVYYAILQSEGKACVAEFDRFLELNPSLLHCGEQAKAAVLYPPNGMNLMLLGETGVGKSMFALLVFQYALAMGKIKRADAFISFNCADYANNSQLLLSQLFGTQKGAYTGAEADKVGLMEAADGGILFLDEVHRLPPEGQEMLFTYIDRGVFRRLGETGNERKANVMLVCATTECPESALLKTFIRRIPMMIRIPSLAERTFDERLQLISDFFLEESANLSAPVQVSVNSMRALLAYLCAGNIGQLKSDIQLLCARAYADYISGKSDLIRIASFGLPTHIRNGIFAEQNRRQIWNRLAGIKQRFLVFDAEQLAPPQLLGGNHTDIYKIIEQRTEDMQRIGLKQDKIQEEIGEILHQYYNSYKDKEEGLGFSDFERFVGSEIMATVDKIIHKATGVFGSRVDESVRYGLSMHLHNAVQRTGGGELRIQSGFNDLKNTMPKLYNFSVECLDIVEEDFNVRLPFDEAGFIALFFMQERVPAKRSMVQVIVVAHGVGTASNLAATANRLMNADIVRGFDAPLEESSGMVYGRIKEYLATTPNVNEVLLLVDMGSLGNFAQDLERDLNVRAKRFILVSTLHVLEAGRKASLGYSLDEIYEDIKGVNELALSEMNYVTEEKQKSKLYLLAVCTTGEGGARVIKEFLSTRLNMQSGLCEVVAMAVADQKLFRETINMLQRDGRIICVVSAFTTGLPVIHYELSRVFDGSCLGRMQSTIDTEAAFVQVERTLVPMLHSINGTRATRDIRDMLERVGRSMRCFLDGEVMIGAFCHIGCMLDRLCRGEPIGPFPKKELFMEKYADEVKIVEKESQYIAQRYNVKIPAEEVCRITSFFVKNDLVGQ